LRLVLAGALLAACAKREPDWAEDLQSPDPYVRALASIGWALQAPRTAAPALPVLLETIDRSELGLERHAAAALQGAGSFHVDALLQALTSDAFLTEDRRGAILNALVNSGPAATGPIVGCLQGPGRAQAGDLGEVLLRIGVPAVPAIRELAQSPDGDLQQLAAILLDRLGPDAQRQPAAESR
jgi:HEAT repeat protein